MSKVCFLFSLILFVLFAFSQDVDHWGIGGVMDRALDHLRVGADVCLICVVYAVHVFVDT